MDYIDNQAEESEGESSDASIGDEPVVKKRKLQEKKDTKKKKKKQIESSDEDDEDDEDKAAEEMKDFIADGEEEEEEEDAKSEKSEKLEEELDEDDLDLIDENMDNQGRPRKRIVQMSDSEDEDDRNAIRNQLFGNDDEGEGPSQRAAPREFDNEREYSDSEQSEDNFIVNEDGDRPVRRHHYRKDLNMPEGALDEARDIFGVEDFNLDEFYDEDEEGMDEEDEEMMDEDGEMIPRPRKTAKEKKSTLLDTMDPSELERGFLAPQDKKIQLEDKPERMQLRKTPVVEADEPELEIESKWIYKHAFTENTVSKQPSTIPQYINDRMNDPDRHIVELHVQTAIKEALRFMRNQLFEVPFINFYRKEALQGGLTLNELWKVYEFDEKWCHLKQRKDKLLELMKRMQNYQIDGDSTHRRIIMEADIHELNGVDSAEALADVYAQFQLYYGSEIAKMQEWEKNRNGGDEAEDALPTGTKFKQSSRNDRYQFCVENGIDGLVARFGLTARQFAENLDWKRHDVDQDASSINAAAAEYLSTVFTDADTVIKGAVFMMAKEISRQPLAREKIRRMYRKRAVVSVRPTKQGREQLDDSSPVYNKRYITAKPINDLEDDEYLLYHSFKNSGFLDVKIICDSDMEKERNETLADAVVMDGPFKRDEYSELVEDWNKVREDAVRMAVNEMLIPYFEQELHQQLLEEAKQFVMEKCAQNLSNRVNMAGYRPNKDDIDEDDGDFRVGDVRAMAIAYPTEVGEASFGAVVDQDGNVLDYVRMVHLLKRSNGEGYQARLKEEAMGFFKKMIERKRPHIVGICGENMEALRIKKDLDEALENMYREGTIHMQPQVVIVDNENAKVFMHSKTALADFPDYPPILRQAVSAARTIVDPLIEYAHLWNADGDIFCLHFHSLQKELHSDHLTNVLLREMINRVNDVGVDINRCLENAHHTNQIQFVAGLGPRKAVHLLKLIKHADNLLESRTKLVTMARMGPKVFMNCAGFIKIDTGKVGERTDQYVEVLDGSRVHPETYEWARKMAVDALEVDDSADPTGALEEILQAPERLKDLDLDAFAEELKRQGFGEKRSTLYDISTELHQRYRDRRDEFQPLSHTAVLDMLSKDAREMFKEGRLVQGTIFAIQHKRLTEEERNRVNNDPKRDQSYNQWICEFCNGRFNEVSDLWEHAAKDSRQGGCTGSAVGVRVRLDNGFTGFIPNKMISDNPKSFNHPLERVQLNKAIWCRIMKVEPEKASCLLSCRTSDLTSEDNSNKDRFWDYNAEERDKEEMAKEKNAKRGGSNAVKRVIQHPSFFNVSYAEAQRLLAKLEQGDAVIRPSSKAPDRLTVTWKVAEGVYANVDVQEEDKEHQFALGKRLMIGPEEYEDLNEILARYVQPMAGYARDIVLYKYYVEDLYGEDIEKLESRLREERRKAPSRVPYFLTASEKMPGKFVISYVAPGARRGLHEYMTVTPEGIRFRRLMFPSLDKLLGWFKEHYNELPGGGNPYSRR